MNVLMALRRTIFKALEAAFARLRRLRQVALAAAAVSGLPGCINAYYQAPHTSIDEHVYASFYPYFAEYCAVSEFNKKQGFGVDLEGGGPGGHSVLYSTAPAASATRAIRCLPSAMSFRLEWQDAASA